MGEQRLRTSILTQERPERGEEQEILQGKSDEIDSPTQLQDDSTRDDEEAKNDFWTITGEFVETEWALRFPRDVTRMK